MVQESEHADCTPPIQEGIDKQGFFVCNFTATDSSPAFSYTIGLRETESHPDFLTMGLSLETNSYLVVAASEAVKTGKRFELNCDYEDFLEGYPIRFLPILQEHLPNHFGFAFQHYGTREIDAIQIVWPDKSGKWGWEEDCSPNLAYCQKLLDRDPNFDFYCPKNHATFCTKGVFEGMPILDVYHDHEGDWQFHADEPGTTENAMMVCLEEVVNVDPTVNQLFDMDRGNHAWRGKT